MSIPHPGPFKEFAWNGVRFQGPARWEPCEIGPRHLKLDQDSLPVFEVKWVQAGRRFSHEAALGRIAKAVGGDRDRVFSADELPDAWKNALAGFSCRGFFWKSGQASGRGALLFCPDCGKATALQFLGPMAREPESCARLLETFSDHGPGPEVPWAVFDIRARIPARFALVRHAFFPGRFEMAFADKKEALTLNRWGPASVLLAGRDATAFARAVLPFPADARKTSAQGPETGTEWEALAETPWAVFSRRLTNRPVGWKRRLWVVREKDKILSVTWAGGRREDHGLMKSVCEAYEVV